MWLPTGCPHEKVPSRFLPALSICSMMYKLHISSYTHILLLSSSKTSSQPLRGRCFRKQKEFFSQTATVSPIAFYLSILSFLFNAISSTINYALIYGHYITFLLVTVVRCGWLVYWQRYAKSKGCCTLVWVRNLPAEAVPGVSAPVEVES